MVPVEPISPRYVLEERPTTPIPNRVLPIETVRDSRPVPRVQSLILPVTTHRSSVTRVLPETVVVHQNQNESVVEQKVSHAIQMCTNLTHSAEDRMCRRLESEYHDFTRRLESERCERQAMMDELRNDFSRQRATLDNATAGLAVMRQQAVVHGGFSQKDTDPSVVEIKSRMSKSSGLDGAQNLEDLRSIVRLHGDKLGALMCDVDALTTRMPEFAAEVKLELEKEAKVRSRENAEAVRRIESVSEALANKGENWSSLSKEMGVLAGNLDAVAIQVDAFNGLRDEDTGDRRAAEASIVGSMSELRELLRHEIQDRSKGDENLAQAVRELQDECREISRLPVPERVMHSDEVECIRARVKEVESLLVSHVQERHKDDRQRIEQERAESSTNHRIERWLHDLSSALEEERKAREAMAEETEQMFRAHRGKLRGMVNTAAETASQAREEIVRSMHEHVDAEKKTRELQHEICNTELAHIKKALDMIQTTMFGTKKEERAEDRSLENWESVECRRELKDLHAGLLEERAAREHGDAVLDERFDFLEAFLTDARELFRDGLRNSWQQRVHRMPVPERTSLPSARSAS